MILQKLSVGPLACNCYIIGCEETKKAAVIDPGAEGERILHTLKQTDLKIELIINTHGHKDHTGADNEVAAVTGAAVLLHRDDADTVNDPQKNFAYLMGITETISVDRFLEEGEIIKIGKLEFKVIHTPGHTPGGICLFGAGVLFSGDTLFAGAVGRTDLPDGSFDALINSIREKLLVLPPETVVYPGHGPKTTIAAESSDNPFLS